MEWDGDGERTVVDIRLNGERVGLSRPQDTLGRAHGKTFVIGVCPAPRLAQLVRESLDATPSRQPAFLGHDDVEANPRHAFQHGSIRASQCQHAVVGGR